MLSTGNAEGSDRTLMSLAVLLAFVVLCAVGVAGHRLQWPSATVFWWGLFVTWAAASILWAVDPSKCVERLPTVVSLFLLYLVASSFRITEKEFSGVISFAILGGAAAGVMAVYGYYFGVGFAQHYVRATLVMANGEQVNPNRFGGCLLPPLAFALGRLMSARTGWLKVIWLSCLAMVGFAILLTMSRGAILAAVVTITVFFWRMNSLKLQSLKPKIRRSLMVLIILAVVAGATVPATIFQRFEQSQADRGAGRLDIWMVGLAIFENYPVAGAGLGNFPVVFNQFQGYAEHQEFNSDRDSHNVYLAIAAEEGLVGICLFLMAIRTQFKISSIWRKQAESPITLVACEAAACGVLVACVFGNLLWDKVFWITWVLLAFAFTVQAGNQLAGQRARTMSPQV